MSIAAPLSAADLPPEILEHIFLRVQPVIPDYTPFVHIPPENGHRYIMRQDWIWITHVCRYWRDVGLASSSLWTNIFLGRRPSIHEYDAGFLRASLSRSRDRPLVVRIVARHHARMDGPLLQEIFQHAFRIKELYIYSRLFFNDLVFPQNLLSSLPLTTLVVQDGHGNQGSLQALFDAGFSHRLTKLECLSAIGWTPPMLQRFQHLRQLHLHQLPHIATGTHSFRYFMTTLQTSPSLEDLVFSHADRHHLMDKVFGTINTTTRVQIPALRRLCFYDCSIRFINTFCSAFEHPPSLTTAILSEFGLRSTEVAEAKAFAGAWFSTTTTLCLVADRHGTDVVGLRGSSAWRFDAFPFLSEAGLDLSVNAMNDVEEIWYDSRLDLRPTQRFSPASYKNAFATIVNTTRNLKKLVVAAPYFDVAWLDVLTYWSEGELPCPQLSTIVFYGFAGPQVRELFKFLAARARAMAPLAHQIGRAHV